ncbi:MAG: hypothetical protein HY815_14965, partial [Candidatus Riflebacteria bacterium]|nr:hypothetical protein [Candidatus Riflebacteria bacterium]
MKSFPTFTTWQWIWDVIISGRFRHVELLNNARYRKDRAIADLEREIGWRYYGGKHYESVFTKFYQAYILPAKFGIDKRRAHFSSLIRNGEMTREQVLEELERPLYTPDDLRTDRDYVIKKLGFTDPEFEEIMRCPPRSHLEFPSDERLLKYLRWGRDSVTSLCRLFKSVTRARSGG